MLHNTNDDGTLTWYCPNPKCIHHSCGDWHNDLQCTHHPSGGITGDSPLSAHVSHDEVSWSSHNSIMLPACECGWRTCIRIPSEEECEPAQVQRDSNGIIKSVAIRDDHPAPNFIVRETTMQKRMPSPDEIAGYINTLQQATSHQDIAAITDAFNRSLHQEVITDVRPHPVISLHTKAAQLMRQHGKEFVQPPD